MSLQSGTVWGSFTGETSARVRPYFTWVEKSVDIVNNTSTMDIILYFSTTSPWYGYGTSNNTYFTLNTPQSNNTYGPYSIGFALPAGSTQAMITLTDVVVGHSADGTGSIYIQFSGSTTVYWGSYNFGATIQLTTIPRRATITSANASLTIGNNKSYTLKNDGGLYVRMEYWINGNAGWYRVKNQNNGTGTSGTFTMSETDNNNMYSRMPSTLSTSAIMRAYTYSDAGYSVQVGDYHDVTGTVSIDSATNVPTFTTYTVANLDKNIVVKDKYENELITSSTSTLLGADTKVLNGYSKVRATITSANKAVAKNYSTMSKYRFTAASKYAEANWSSDSTVNIDIDNVLTGSYSVRAQDSRGLTKTVNNSLTLISPTPVNLWGLTLTRENGVDTKTTMSFVGKMWKQYFGGGTSGVQNAVVCQWRYKETTASWAAQSWTTITGDLDIDANGNISFEEVINGDLGASGFDSEKSFNIEVRIYDKVSQKIIEGTLNVGTPVMDITKDGVSFMGRYDSDSGGAIQLYSNNIENGWIPANETWSYASADAPTFTFTVAANVTTKYSVGMRVKYTQTTVKYGIITAVSAYSGGNTTITIYGGTDYTMTSADISANFYSSQKAPQGFPLNPLKWSLFLTDANNRSQESPAQNTWYNLNSSNIYIPIGSWKVSMSVQLAATRASAGYCGVRNAFSTSTSSVSDLKLHLSIDGNPVTQLGFTTVHGENYILLSSKTRYYVITRTTASSVGTIYRQDLYINIVCAYL